MVAPLVGAAAIGAAGSLIGGITGGKGAKKAAKTQAAAADRQIAALQQNQQYVAGLAAPTIDRGNAAGDVFAGLLGVGGNPQASQQALETFRGSSGYRDLVDEGLAAVNSNAYARGLGNSGSTLKALQRTGASLADRSQQGYLGNLGSLMNLGNAAVGNVAGVATNTTGAINNATQQTADARGNAALVQGAGWQQALQGLANAGASALGSSYGGGTVSGGINNIPPIYRTPGIGGY